MNPVFEAAYEVQQFMHARGWRLCIVGGLAVVRWGEPRATQDVDVTLLTGFGIEDQYIRETLAHFASRVSGAADFALENRVLLVAASNGVPVDIALGGIEFETQAVSRATPFEFAPGCALVTCSAEDLVVLKAFADRERDWADIEGIVVRQADALDWTYIHEHLLPLCELKGAPEIADRLVRLRESTRDD